MKGQMLAVILSDDIRNEEIRSRAKNRNIQKNNWIEIAVDRA